MTRADWLCPVCRRVMVLGPSGQYMICYGGTDHVVVHGKLHPRWSLKDLLRMEKVISKISFSRELYGNSKTFVIERNRDYLPLHEVKYEYVPHGHATALDKAPREGEMVASVAFRGHRAVRLFRRKGA